MNNDPVSTILQITGGYCLPRCLQVAADLGVADALDETPRTASELGAAVGADADALGRAMRLLAAHGVFECRGDKFVHSPASRMLRRDHPQSLRALARMFGLPVMWAATLALDQTIRNGRPAPDVGYPGGLWKFLADHPDANDIFNDAMSGKAQGQVAGVIAAYEFSGLSRVADIGGGSGHLIRAVLDAAPTASGVLFDQPHVVAQVAASKRLTVQGGDFFKDAMPACDAYTLMEVIHDWADEESVAILRAIARAATPSSKLLLIEQIVPNDPGPHWTRTLDMHMLALFGGCQRTLPEYRALLAKAGFTIRRVIETQAGVTIMEATLS